MCNAGAVSRQLAIVVCQWCAKPEEWARLYGSPLDSALAYLHQDQRAGKWFVCFRWNGTQHNKGCETKNRSEADIICARVRDAFNCFVVAALSCLTKLNQANGSTPVGKRSATGLRPQTVVLIRAIFNSERFATTTCSIRSRKLNRL